LWNFYSSKLFRSCFSFSAIKEALAGGGGDAAGGGGGGGGGC